MNFINNSIDYILDFLEKTDDRYIFLGILIAFIIGHLIVQRKNSLKLTLQYRLNFYVIAMLVISMTLPYTSVRFHYDVSDLENKKILLGCLQDYNEAIAKTRNAVDHMIVITILFAFSVVKPIIKYLKIDKSVK